VTGDPGTAPTIRSRPADATALAEEGLAILEAIIAAPDAESPLR
jgi:hypothetical protein